MQMFNGCTMGVLSQCKLNFDENADNKQGQESNENSPNEQLNKIKNEINELNDSENENDKIEIQGILNKKFADYLKNNHNIAQQLWDAVNNIHGVGSDNEKAINDLKNFLKPIVNPVTIEQDMENPSETGGSFYEKNLESGDEAITKDIVQEKINKILESIGEDQQNGENENITKFRNTINNINKVLENPNSENTKKLQKFLLDNLDGDERNNFLKLNFKNKNGNNPDGLFGQNTLNGLNQFLGKLSNYINNLNDAQAVMNEHEQINAQIEQEAEAEKQRIKAQKKKEQKDVSTLVSSINTNVLKEKEYIDQLNVDTVFANYPLKGVGKIDRAITKLKHIDDVQKQAEDLKNEWDRLNDKKKKLEENELKTSGELLEGSTTKRGKRFAKRKIRTYEREIETYERQIHEINSKYNELKNQEDLKTPIEQRIREQLDTIKSEYQSQFKKLNEKVNRLKGIDLSDFSNDISGDAKELVKQEQEKRISAHKSEIDKYNRNMDSILSFLGSKYESGKLVDDPDKTTPFEKFLNKYVKTSFEGADLSQDDLENIIELLKRGELSDFGKLDVDGFKFNDGMLINEGDIKYIKIGDNKFQLCDKNTKNIASSLVCLVSGGALYFASYKDGKVSSDGALLHSKELQQGDGSENDED